MNKRTWGEPVEGEWATASDLRPVDDWRPIETAPDKGTFLLSNGRSVTIATREATDYWVIHGYREGVPPEAGGFDRWQPLPNP